MKIETKYSIGDTIHYRSSLTNEIVSGTITGIIIGTSKIVSYEIDFTEILFEHEIFIIVYEGESHD